MLAVRSVCLVLLVVSTATAKDKKKADKADDPGITRQQADDILKELRSIRQMLDRFTQPQAPPVPQTGRMRLEGGYTLGSADAPVTIVGFTDYQCPFCRQFEQTTFAQIRKQYIDTGKVRFVIRDFPLPTHPDAMQQPRRPDEQATSRSIGRCTMRCSAIRANWQRQG